MILYTKDPLFENKNIYSCLVKKTDLKYKNTFGLRTPTLEINKEEIITLTKKKYKNFNEGFLHFIKQLENYLGIKYTSIYKIKRNRYNNHYYICSKKFRDFIKNNTNYELPWQPLNKSEINNVSKEWIL